MAANFWPGAFLLAILGPDYFFEQADRLISQSIGGVQGS
jgi:hypothetical protein